MPLMNGMECLKELRTNSRLQNIPIYMYTTGCEPQLTEEAIRSGAKDVIEKPSGFDHLKQYYQVLLKNKWNMSYRYLSHLLPRGELSPPRRRLGNNRSVNYTLVARILLFLVFPICAGAQPGRLVASKDLKKLSAEEFDEP